MSHVGISNSLPTFTLKTNSLGVMSLLEFAKEVCPEAKIYQASSSEMFGNSIDKDGYLQDFLRLRSRKSLWLLKSSCI